MRRGVLPASAVKSVNSAPVKVPALTVRVPVVRSPGTTNEYVASKSPSSALPFPVVSPASLTVAVTGEPPVGVKVTKEPGNGACAPR